MARYRIARLWFCVALCVAPAASARSLSQEYARLQAAEMPRPDETDNARSSRVTRGFTRFFSRAQARYRTLSGADLHTLLAAAVEAGDFSESLDLVSDAESDLAALAARHEASDQDYRNVYGALVLHRQFAQAQQLYIAHPVRGMRPVSNIVDAAGPPHSGQTVYAVTGDGTHFVRQSRMLPRTGILVVGQPGCHFSVDAARAIHGDVALAALFRDHSIWLAPAQHPLDEAELRAWNSAFPEAALSISERNSAWPVIDHWSTPTFYMFRDGKLVQETPGWPPAGGWAAFAHGLRQIGLNPPAMPAAPAVSADPTIVRAGTAGLLQALIDRGTAPIRSRADLDAYLRTAPLRDSLLRSLTARPRGLFLAGLIFDQSGAQHVPLDPLRGLTATQAYRLLSLFGWQSEVRSIPGLRA